MKKNRSDENTPVTENQTEEFVTWCGGIKPFILPEQEEEMCADGPSDFE